MKTPIIQDKRQIIKSNVKFGSVNTHISITCYEIF